MIQIYLNVRFRLFFKVVWWISYLEGHDEVIQAFLYFAHLYFTGCASERVMDVALSEINEWMFERGATYVIFLQNSQEKKK